MPSRPLLASLLAVCAASSVLAQTPDDQVRLQTDLVEVRAVVTDAHGTFVAGLSKDDFEVIDGGAPQSVAFFSEERVAGPRAAGSGGATGATDAGAGLPEPASRPAPAARTIVVLVDDFHLAPNSLARVREALKRFVAEDLSDRDLFGLFAASGRVRLFGQFGRDRSAVLAAIDAIPFTPQTKWPDGFTPYLASLVKRGSDDDRPTDYAVNLIRQQERDFVTPKFAMIARAKSLSTEILQEDASWRTASLDTLKHLCDQLAGMPGQRLILLYSDGFTLRDESGEYTDKDVRAVVSHAARAGVVVSAIVAKGLAVDMGVTADEAAAPSLDGFTYQMKRASVRDLETGPGAIAKQTGGAFYTDTNDIEKLGRETLAHNADYYALGYYTPEPGATTYRSVTVRVRAHPDYTVRTLEGYVPAERRALVAPAKDMRVRLVESLVRPILPTDLDVTVELGGFEAVKDRARMALRATVDARDLNLRDVGGGRVPFEVDVTTVVYDLHGDPAFVGSDHVSGILTADDAETAKETGLRYTVVAGPLKPGVYQARVAFSDPATGRIGARALWIVVPPQSERNRAR